MGVGGKQLYLMLFIIAAVLCADSVVRSDWAATRPRKGFGGAVVALVYLAFGAWIFLRPHASNEPRKEHSTNSGSPQQESAEIHGPTDKVENKPQPQNTESRRAGTIKTSPPSATEIAEEVAKRIPQPQIPKVDHFKDYALGLVVEMEDANKNLLYRWDTGQELIRMKSVSGESMVKDARANLHKVWHEKFATRTQAARDELAKKNIRDDELDQDLAILDTTDKWDTPPQSWGSPHVLEHLTKKLREMLNKMAD